MTNNALIEIGSKANIVLRFKANITINGKDYLANEPYLYMKNVNILINYSNQDKTGTTTKTVIADSQINPRTVTIGNIEFTKKIASLLSTYVNSNTSYNTTKFVKLTASGDIIYLTDEIDSAADIFVYDSDFDKVDSVSYVESSNSLTSVNFIDQEQYIISYSSVRIGTKFDLQKTHTPYMSLEIQGTGNIDKKTKNVLMYFDKVSLNSMIDFTFIQEGMMNVPLSFHIIDNKNNYIIFEDDE